MKSIVKETLNEKGIEVPNHILLNVTSRWQRFSEMKNEVSNLPLSTTDIAVRNIPRGDYSEQ